MRVSSPALSDPGVRGYLKRAFVSGLGVTIPVLVTLLVLLFALNFLTSLLEPFVVLLRQSLGIEEITQPLLAEIVAIVVLGLLILVVGTVAESRFGKEHFEHRFDAIMSNIPGIGRIYRSIDEISDLLLESDTDSFQEVKLVEYPHEGSYALAFLTAETPGVVETATGHPEMRTLFMPMSPNPVMGGFVIHVPEDRVHDIDLTVEEGIRAVVSSGVSINTHGDTAPEQIDDFGPDELR